MISLNILANHVHEIAKSKGWDDTKSIDDIIALCYSELSEASEEYRNGHGYKDIYIDGQKPKGIGIKLADCIIRILDFCGHAGINIEKCIEMKMEYNETRAYRHGGKKL